ncbi:mitochondrial import receptor subunit tom22 [Paecilomyces variotii No. 5]|uniref:Mitochondrial import receptor subunit tom22 n=1 Tax=Byssochlamys spectabilis (strain No. 5 / NBRC 109023) TaxID=1356009 RepID=V5FZC4_BYSSN|nr:mitochondrial import receptor subunit tom22 [Paecilomyces variotii No. 5]
MVKLTEVEDEHFKEKPTASKNDALLASDDEEDDFTDTGPGFPDAQAVTSARGQILHRPDVSTPSHANSTVNCVQVSWTGRNPSFARFFCKMKSEISTDSALEIEQESLYDRISALKDMIPPAHRRRFVSTVDSVTSFTKSSLLFSGRALWVISTSAFLLGVPWALAYAEEEQYVQMEREQGMIRGANEMLAPGVPGTEEQKSQPTL